MQLRLSVVTASIAAAAGALTLVVVCVPSVHFAYRQPGLHTALESVAGVVALFAAALIAGRFQLSGRIDVLILSQGLLFLAATNIFLAAIPEALQRVDQPSAIRFSSWGALIGRLIGDLLIATSAFAPARQPRRRHRSTLVVAVGATSLLFIALVIADAVASPHLSEPVSTFPGNAAWPRLEAHTGALAAQLVSLVAYGLAAVGFTRRGVTMRDPLIRYLAVATTLGAFARLNYALYPSLYSSWLYVGDIFRSLVYVTLLVGAFHEVARYSQEVAVLEERRRIAREVHDSIAQELAFVVREGKRVGLPAEIVEAAERGLAESRRAIATLRHPSDDHLYQVLLDATQGIVTRGRSRVEIEVPKGLQLPGPTNHVLAQITREAVANAARHGLANHIRVAVGGGDGPLLTVADDGVGFDALEAKDGRYGIIGMRERAESVGGRLVVRSTPGKGSVVEVMLA